MSERIVISFDSCHRRFGVKSELIGERIRCPGCRNAIDIVESPAGTTQNTGGTGKPRSVTTDPISRDSPRSRSAHRSEKESSEEQSSRTLPARRSSAHSDSRKADDHVDRPGRRQSSASDRNRTGKSTRQQMPDEINDDNLVADFDSSENGVEEYDLHDNSRLPPRQNSNRGRPASKSAKGTGTQSTDRGGSKEILPRTLSMVAALVWFFGGIYVGYIFFYPPVLFVLGLIGFVKGLMKG